MGIIERRHSCHGDSGPKHCIKTVTQTTIFRQEMKRATLLSNGSETEMTTEDLSGRDAGIHIDYDAPIADDITTESGQHPDEVAIKIILVGDSAVGKSKLLAKLVYINISSYIFLFCLCYIHRLVERFLMEDYKPHQLSTYALTLFRYKTKIQQDAVTVGNNTDIHMHHASKPILTSDNWG